MPRIGEILLEHAWVEPKLLERALAKQRDSGKRLCSLLIESGMLSPDEAARALGEQHHVPAVLQKHFERRDPELAKLLPAPLARSACALPIGRMGNGDLIVCVRDPRPELAAALSRATGETVMLAVAPASLLEGLIAMTYPGGATPEEFDVDLNTGPLNLDDLGPLTLVELDDLGVSKTPSEIQTGPMVRVPTPASLTPKPRAQTLPPANASRTTPLPGTLAIPRTTTPPPPQNNLDAQAGIAAGTSPPSRRFLEQPVSLADTCDALASARTTDAAADAAMKFAKGRWAAALLLLVKDGAAIGQRGHGKQLSDGAVQGVAIPLTGASLIKAAHDGGKLVTEVPPDCGALEDRLERLLGLPRYPAAVPIRVAAGPSLILAIGDPLADDTAAATADLSRLASALGAAFTRIAGG